MTYCRQFKVVILLFLLGLTTTPAMASPFPSPYGELIFVFQQATNDVPLLAAIHAAIRQKGYRTIQMTAPVADDRSANAPVDYGTGFFISETGLLFTSQHVIQGARTIVLRTLEGETFKARVLAEDRTNDIAILAPLKEKRVPHWLSLGEFTEASVGKKIRILGYPFPFVLKRPSSATGIIAKDSGMFGNKNSLQISAPIHPGNSGSPILDEDNRVIGIVNEQWFGKAVIKANESLPPYLNFGIKVNFAKPVIALLKHDHHVSTLNKPALPTNAEAATAVVMVNTNDIPREVPLPGNGRLIMIELDAVSGFDLICYTEVQLREDKAGNIGSETKTAGCIAGGPKTPRGILAEKVLLEIQNSMALSGAYRADSSGF